MIGLALRIDLITDADRARCGIPPSETFAYTLSSGEVLGTDEDVPTGVHPVEFGSRLATLRGAVFIGPGRGLRFALLAGGWTGWDALLCAPHRRRNCRTCGPEVNAAVVNSHRVDARCGPAVAA